MKYLKQFLIIIIISLLGELLKYILPFPIPASVYGMVILFVLLCTHIIKVEQVEETGLFLIEIMPVMFVPAAVGLLDSWNILKPVLIPITIITVVSTVVVMVISGHATQIVVKIAGHNKKQ